MYQSKLLLCASASLHQVCHVRQVFCCRRLLARLCIAREEIAEVVAEQQYQNQSGSTEDVYETNTVLHNQSVPKASIAFLKELLTMSDEAKRWDSWHVATDLCVRAWLCSALSIETV